MKLGWKERIAYINKGIVINDISGIFTDCGIVKYKYVQVKMSRTTIVFKFRYNKLYYNLEEIEQTFKEVCKYEVSLHDERPYGKEISKLFSPEEAVLFLRAYKEESGINYSYRSMTISRYCEYAQGKEINTKKFYGYNPLILKHSNCKRDCYTFIYGECIPRWVVNRLKEANMDFGISKNGVPYIRDSVFIVKDEYSNVFYHVSAEDCCLIIQL